MSDPKWTPGPWLVAARGVKPLTRGGFRIDQALGTSIVKTYGGLGDQEIANAYVLAAAPTLWHALVGILESLEDAARNNPEAWLEFVNEIAVDLPLAQATASAAIQKALGESKGREIRLGGDDDDGPPRPSEPPPPLLSK